jgi:hypothetical protein
MKTFTLLTLSFLFFSASCWADGHEGHGATVYDCSNRVSVKAFKGKVILADFAIAEIFRGLQHKIVIPETNATTVNAQILANLHKVELIDENIYQNLKNEIFRIKNAAYDPKTYYWGLTADLGELPQLSPENSCTPKNLIFYNTDNDIEKNSLLLKRLSTNTERAGVWVHEGVYSFTRKYGQQTDATVARLITALIFSTEEHPELLSRMVKGFLRAEYNVPPRDLHLYLDASLATAPRQLVFPACFIQYFETAGGVELKNSHLFWATADQQNFAALSIANPLTTSARIYASLTQYMVKFADAKELRFNVLFQSELQFIWDDAAPESGPCLPELMIGDRVVAMGKTINVQILFTGEENGLRAQATFQKAYDDLPSNQRNSLMVNDFLQNKIDD